MLNKLRQEFESQLEARLMSLCGENEPGLREMLRYHFGWQDDEHQRGKRLRPIIHLLSSLALGQDLQTGMNTAVALEIFHNFTLVHDDIQDKGDFRQGRPALWKHFGIEQAINTGDFMSYAAFDILNQANRDLSDNQLIRINQAFVEAGLDVMRGQHLDMLYEKTDVINLHQYLEMITFKTSRLFSLAFEMAGIINRTDEETSAKLRAIGANIGIAFQIQDDYLGIWGDTQKTGKSVSTDIMTKKKTYPILLGLQKSSDLGTLWNKPAPLDQQSIQDLTELLSKLGIDKLCMDSAFRYKHQAFEDFEKVFTQESNETSALREALNGMIK